MHLACAPRQLGDWSDVFTAALSAGATVHQAQQQLKLATATLDAQRRQQAADSARIAAAQQAAQQRAMVPLPSDGYSVQLEHDALPSWVVPAAIGGGALMLLLLLRR
jgi:hypothetical protein